MKVANYIFSDLTDAEWWVLSVALDDYADDMDETAEDYKTEGRLGEAEAVRLLAKTATELNERFAAYAKARA